MPISLKNTASILPYVRYSPQANSMSNAGEDNKPREIPFLNKLFAMDPENGSLGWLLLGEGIRDWKPFLIGDNVPSSPGPNYKRAFSLLVFAPKLLGSPEAHEMCASTGAHLSFCERLYNEAEPNFGKGEVPLVKLTGAEPIKVGKGKSRELHFEITRWIERPAAITEALAKLKEANATPGKAASGAAAADVGDDFDEPGDVTAPKAEPKLEPKAKKGRGKAQAEPPKPSSDILDDPINDPIPY
jgi:hypothetical protein